MLILTEENQTVDLNLIPDQVDMYYWSLDNSVPSDPDYRCNNLIMLESFYAPVIKLRLDAGYGRHRKTYFLNVPADHQILIGEPSYGDLEVNPISSLSARNFKAFSLNPLTSFMASYLDINIEDALPNIKWFLPKLAIGHLLCLPLHEGFKPPCIYMVRDIPKSMETVKSNLSW
jgi:hypothetical protein